MGQGNSDIIYFLEQHEQEIINCCRKGMSNNEVRELLKTKYDWDVADIMPIIPPPITSIG